MQLKIWCKTTNESIEDKLDYVIDPSVVPFKIAKSHILSLIYQNITTVNTQGGSGHQSPTPPPLPSLHVHLQCIYTHPAPHEL